MYVRYPDINYVMPFMFTNDIWIRIINELLKEEKNPIKHIYGSVYCVWQSGRHAKVFLDDLNVIEEYVKNVSALGLIPNFTFSTLNVSKDKLNDEFCNQLLDIAVKYNSYFITASDLLYKHIKQRYNDAKMVCSVIVPSVRLSTFGFNETKFYNKMLDKYEIVVIRPEYAIENIDKLGKLVSDISRIEILINQTCFYNCHYHKKHYSLQEESDLKRYNAKKNNNQDIQIYEDISSFCPRYTIPPEKYRSVRMNSSQMHQLVQAGVKYFKMQGREGSVCNLINDLYEFFFNSEISKEELISKINLLISDIVLNDRSLQYLYMVN